MLRRRITMMRLRRARRVLDRNGRRLARCKVELGIRECGPECSEQHTYEPPCELA